VTTDGNRAVVLVVDDEPSIRLLCRINLELEGFDVLEAGSLDAARRALDEHDVGAVLLDLHLGREHASALLAELKEMQPPVPVALVTGSADPDVASTAGADSVLAKPFTIDALIDTVRLLTPGNGR
jgi:two-component system response regulator AauR